MKVIAYERVGGRPYVFDASQVVVFDRMDNPIAVAVECGLPGQEIYVVSKATDPDFNRVMRNLGIDKVVICQNFVQDPPKGAALIAGPGV